VHIDIFKDTRVRKSNQNRLRDAVRVHRLPDRWQHPLAVHRTASLKSPWSA